MSDPKEQALGQRARRQKRPRDDAAARSERFYRALIDNTGDILTLVDADGVITYHSPAMREVLGLEPHEAVGLAAHKSVHPDDEELVKRHLGRCIESPGWISMERFRLPHKDGGYRWMESRARNLLDDPDVGAILVVSRDVTELRRLEQDFRAAEVGAHFGYWTWPLCDGDPTWSMGFVNLLGYDQDDTPRKGDWLGNQIHPEDLQRAIDSFARVSETKEPASIRVRIKARDGTYRHITAHGYPQIDAAGQVVALAGVSTDVTGLVEKEEALRQSEEQFGLIAEHALDIVARHSADGRLLFVSPAVKSILGFEPAELLDDTINALLHPDDVDSFISLTSRLLRGEDSVTLMFRLRHKLGHYVWLEATLRAVRDEKTDRTTEIVAISRDIGERKQYEQELMEARERAEAANRTKSQFLANMSHELRTPLNAIMGFSDMVRQEMFGALGSDKYREYAALIHESGVLLLELINDILDMSKIEAGKYEINPEPVDIGELCRVCTRLLRQRADEQGISLVTNVHANICDGTLTADERAVKQILLNLLTNAVKFTPAGGTVTVGASISGDQLALWVEDTGVGIPKDQIPRLTRPFEQVRLDSKVAHEGSGLGLALVKALATLHGGGIAIESDIGKGTRVTVSLPLSPATAVSAQSGGA